MATEGDNNSKGGGRSRGDGLKRLASGAWGIDLTIGGRRIQRSTGTTNLEAARELRDKVANRLWRERKLGEKPRIVFAEAAANYLRRAERNGNTTALETGRKLAQIGAITVDGVAVAELGLDEFDRATISRILEAKRSSTRKRKGVGEVPVSPATVNRYRAALSAVFELARDEGYDVPPDLSFPPMEKESKGRIRWLTKDEAARLLRELPDYLRAMAVFSLATGLRQFNVSHLRWSEVDLDRAVAWVHPEDAKAGDAIMVPLNAEAVSVLIGQRGKHREWVFPGPLGRPMVQVGNSAWRSALDRAGIKGFRWHDLRHTWATWHIQSGTPVEVLQKLGGWKTLSMVMRYAHFAPGFLARFAGGSAGPLQQARAEAENLSEVLVMRRGGFPCHPAETPVNLAPRVGIEPTTHGLTDRQNADKAQEKQELSAQSIRRCNNK